MTLKGSILKRITCEKKNTLYLRCTITDKTKTVYVFMDLNARCTKTSNCQAGTPHTVLVLPEQKRRENRTQHRRSLGTSLWNMGWWAVVSLVAKHLSQDIGFVASHGDNEAHRELSGIVQMGGDLGGAMHEWQSYESVQHAFRREKLRLWSFMSTVE